MDILCPPVSPGEVAVGDWISAVGMPFPHPVITVNRRTVAVGVDRAIDGWGETVSVPYDEILTVIPAVVHGQPFPLLNSLPTDTQAAIHTAVQNVRTGYLSEPQRDALANLLVIASQSSLPTPLVALVHTTLRALADHTNHRQRPA